MEGRLDLGLKRERSLRPIFPAAGLVAGIAGLAWRRGAGGVTAGREGAGVAGGTTELGGATGMRVAATDGEGDETGMGAGGGVERGAGGGFP